MNVYDFDDTIYDGESPVDLFFEYIKIRPSLVKLIPKVLRALYRYKKGKITVDGALKEYGPIIRDCFLAYDDWDNFINKFWDDHMDKIKPFYYETRRDDDVIVTNSPRLTMEPICERLGIKHLICTEMDMETGEITRSCLRENKVTAFYEDFPDAVIENFYTDSYENDRFIADLAQHVYIVKGNNLTLMK